MNAAARTQPCLPRGFKAVFYVVCILLWLFVLSFGTLFALSVIYMD